MKMVWQQQQIFSMKQEYYFNATTLRGSKAAYLNFFLKTLAEEEFVY